MEKFNKSGQQLAKINRIGVVGAGTMGSGIALTALFADLRVTLYDVSQEMLDRAYEYIEHHLNRKRMVINIKYLTLSRNLEDMHNSEVVIEAIPEDLDLKIAIFSKLDRICPPPAILATNTSTLSVTRIAAAVDQPERIAGMHFFNPAPVLPLVEVIRGARTASGTIESAVRLAKRLGKTPVVAKDTPGFIVNRVARPFYGEALRILGEGVASHEQIDTIVEKGGGFRMGPFRLMDLIGIDVNYTATKSIYEQTYHEPRYRPNLIQDQMVAQKALGRKTGWGFYRYKGEENHKESNPSPTASQGIWQVYLSPGTWAPGLREKCAEAGYKVEEASNGWSNQDIDSIGIVMAGRAEGLKEYLQFMDHKLPPEVPIICQGVDVAMSNLATWSQRPDRLAAFDGLLFNDAEIVTLVARSHLQDHNKSKINAFFNGLGYLTSWVEESPGLILPRIICCLTNEAAFAVGEGVAQSDTIDIGMRLGTNYPYGPIEWGKQIGFERVVQVLEHLQAEYGEERYRVAPTLRRWARSEEVDKAVSQ